MIKKGIYPHNYTDSFERFEETKPPPKEVFYDILKNKHIIDEDYNHVNKVWDIFDIKNMGEQHDLYVKTDVLVLSEIFQDFRQNCFKIIGLDPLWYYTAAGLFYDALLKITGIKLNVIQDEDMYLFLEKGKRGGMVDCRKRYVKANNKHMKSYDKNKPSRYIMYFDINSLYPTAMGTMKIPYGGFEWINNLNENMEIEELKTQIGRAHV